jgi:hypothetical protein
MHLWRRVSTVALAGICTLAVAACGNSDNGGDEGSISSEKTGEISASDQLDFGQTSVGGDVGLDRYRQRRKRGSHPREHQSQ